MDTYGKLKELEKRIESLESLLTAAEDAAKPAPEEKPARKAKP